MIYKVMRKPVKENYKDLKKNFKPVTGECNIKSLRKLVTGKL